MNENVVANPSLCSISAMTESAADSRRDMKSVVTMVFVARRLKIAEFRTKMSPLVSPVELLVA